MRKRLDKSQGAGSCRSLVAVVSGVTLMLSAGGLFAQDWPVPGGTLRNERTATQPLESGPLVPALRLPTPGLPNDILVDDVDGDPDVEIGLVAGGRVVAYKSDGSREWSSTPNKFHQVLPPFDLDGDERPELIVRKEPTGVAVLRGHDGRLLWDSRLEDLGRVGSILRSDFNGDGLDDVLFAEADCGAATRQVGRAIAYSFADTGQPRELFRLEEGTREYYCGRYMGLADVDGDGRSEIVAPSTSRIHLYSSVDGEHLGATPDVMPSLPYGVGELYAQDIDHDGSDEILLLTNNRFPPDINSRRAMLLEWDREEEQLEIIWDINVEDAGRDRHAWPSDPLIDLDADGEVEFIHGFYQQSSDRWTTYVREPATGQVLWQTAGRPMEVVRRHGGKPWVLLADLQPSKVVAFSLGADGFVEQAHLKGDAAFPTSSEWVSSGQVRRVVNRPGTGDPSFYLVSSRDEQGQPLGERRLHAYSHEGSEVASFEYDASNVLGGHSVNSQTFFVFAQRDSGRVRLLNAALEELPLVKNIVSSGQARDEFLGRASTTLGQVWLGRGKARFDLSQASLGNRPERTVSPLRLLGLFEANGDAYPDRLVMNDDYREEFPDLAVVDGKTGQYRWVKDHLVNQQATTSVYWRKNSLVADITGDGVEDVIVQTDNPGTDVFRLNAFDGATGRELWASPMRLPSAIGGGTGRTISFSVDTEFRLVTTIRSTLYAIDAITGEIHSQVSGRSYSCCLGATPTEGGAAVALFLNAHQLARWVGFDHDLGTLWRQGSLNAENSNRYTGSGVSIIRERQRTLLVEGRAAAMPRAANWVVLDANDGGIIHRLNLSEGQVRLASEDVVEESLNAGVGFHSSSGSDALYLTSSRSGYIYLLRPGADPDHPAYPSNVLVRAIKLGSELGDVSAIDVDNDGYSEAVVATFDGHALVLDTPALEVSVEVNDTNCVESADVDEITFKDRFCASWSPAQREVDGFVVTLVDVASGASVARPKDVGLETSVQFDNLRLLAGETYQVHVQAYVGRGISAMVSGAFVSDGAEVIEDEQPPTITDFAAQPPNFVASQGTTRIMATLRDPSPLASYRVRITNPVGEQVFEQVEQLNTGEYRVQIDWNGRTTAGEVLPTGSYQVSLLARDFTGLESQAQLNVELVDTSSFAVRVPEDPGCGCGLSLGTRRGGPLATVVVFLLLVGISRCSLSTNRSQ